MCLRVGTMMGLRERVNEFWDPIINSEFRGQLSN